MHFCSSIFQIKRKYIKFFLIVILIYVIILIWIQIRKINCRYYFICGGYDNEFFRNMNRIKAKNFHLKQSDIIEEFNLVEEPESNQKCPLEKLNEWDPKIKTLFKSIPRYNSCIKNEPLTFIKNDILYINQAINKTYFKGLVDLCEVAPILRNTTNNDNYKTGQFIKINEGFIRLDKDYEYFKVRCISKDTELIRSYKKRPKTLSKKTKAHYIDQKSNYKLVENNLVVYEYVHFNIIKKLEENFTNSSKNVFNDDKLNVMILVLDGVSLSSMKRALPNTLKYLKSFEEFFLFEKHHVTGENTFQNLIPMLTNLNYIEIDNYTKSENQSTSNKNLKTIQPPFDDVPFIWKEFKKNDYITYFSEEWRKSTFYNLKFGFRQKPTDYYLRPYWLALYDSLSYPPTNLNSNSKPCYFNKLLHFISFDWLNQFEQFYSKNFDKNIPRFGLVKINEMSHDYLERLFWIDYDLINFLKQLFKPKFLNNTLFILMGDHGHRFHKIRETYTGKLEEKLPMFGMLIPKLISFNNTILIKNLIQNTKKLTTWYDVYETLLHILMDQSNLKNDKAQSKYFRERQFNEKIKKKGYSLFTKIPHRNCNESNIPEYLCSCGVSLTIDTNNTIIQKAAHILIDYINKVLLKDYQNMCMILTLSHVIDAQKNNDKYSVIFQAQQPSNAVFDGTFKLIETGEQKEDEIYFDKNFKLKLIGKIIRINTYGTTSKCIQNYWLKNFCFCSSKYRNNRKFNPFIIRPQ